MKRGLLRMRKTGFIKTVALLLAIVMFAIPLSACGKKGDNGGQELSEFVFVPQYASFPKEITEMNNITCVGDTIYFTMNAPTRSDGSVITPEELEKMQKEMDEYYANQSGGTVEGGAVAAEPRAVVSAVGTGSDVVVDTAPVAPGVPDGEAPQWDVTYVPRLYKVKTDGTGLTQLSDYVYPTAPEGNYNSAGLNRIAADTQGNLWALENVRTTIFDLPEGFDETTEDPWQYHKEDISEYTVRKLSETGAELTKLDLTEFIEKPEQENGYNRGVYINDMYVDKSGNVYLGQDSGIVYVLNADGSFNFKVKTDGGWFDRFITLRDGSVGVSTSGDAGRVLKTIDVAAKGWGKEFKISSDVWNTSSGGNLYDFCYTDGSSLYGYKLDEDKEEKILTWINCEVDGDRIQYSTVLDDGNVFAISNNWDNEGGATFEVLTLTKTPRSEVAEKKVITYATVWLDWNIKKEILKFNKTNPEYKIEIKDYSEFNSDEDWSAGITKLNTEIISGNIPDIIQLDNLPYKQYASKGLLEDLYPFIDSDSELSREDFFPSILKAFEVEEKLYPLIPSFQIMSMVGASSVVGEEPGWTMREMQEIIKQNPQADAPFGLYMTKEQVFNVFCMLNMESYMDWETGECSFDSDEFKALLEFANSFPEKIDDSEYENWIDPTTLIAEGRQIMNVFNLYDLQWSIQETKAQFSNQPITFKGFPSEDKNGTLAMVSGGLAMTSSCKYKEGAWAFMRTLLTEEYQKSMWNLPINKNVFDEKLAEAMKQEYDSEGNPISIGSMGLPDGSQIEFYALTQADADLINSLINSVERTATQDESLMNIIKEEANIYFAGEKSVDEIASIIQSRMKIYINEQR